MRPSLPLGPLALVLVLRPFLAMATDSRPSDRERIFLTTCASGVDAASAILPRSTGTSEVGMDALTICNEAKKEHLTSIAIAPALSEAACVGGVVAVFALRGLKEEAVNRKKPGNRSARAVEACLADVRERGMLVQAELEKLVPSGTCFQAEQADTFLQVTHHADAATYLRVWHKGRWNTEFWSMLSGVKGRPVVPCPEEPKR